MAQKWKLRRARKSDSEQFLQLVKSLADFERLNPPTAEAGRRMVRDVFVRKRVSLFVAESEHRLIGYALYFYTYSSFLAKPTLYLEDLFVLQEKRKGGIGKALFLRCVNEAARRGCGRMEWSVLNWNTKAIGFYEVLGARRLKEWSTFRLDERALGKLVDAA